MKKQKHLKTNNLANEGECWYTYWAISLNQQLHQARIWQAMCFSQFTNEFSVECPECPSPSVHLAHYSGESPELKIWPSSQFFLHFNPSLKAYRYTQWLIYISDLSSSSLNLQFLYLLDKIFSKFRFSISNHVSFQTSSFSYTCITLKEKKKYSDIIIDSFFSSTLKIQTTANFSSRS